MIAPFAWMLVAGMAATQPSDAPAAQPQLASATAPTTALAVQSAYPVVVTDQLVQCRDFYTRQLGFRVVFEASWFVYLESAGDRPYGIAFMHPDHPSRPPGPEPFGGKGVLVTLQVADAAAEFARLSQAGVAIAYPIKDEPWGQRRFGLIDPAGVWVDVVEQISPAPDYWAAYPPAG